MQRRDAVATVSGLAPPNAKTLGAVALGAVALGAAAVWASAAGLLAAVALFVAAVMFFMPRVAIVVFAVFLAIQPALVNLAGGRDTSLGEALQRVDEVILLVGLLRVVAVLRHRVRSSEGLWIGLTGAFVLVGLASGALRDVPASTVLLGAFLAIKFPLFVLFGLTIPWKASDARRIVRAGVIAPIVTLCAGVALWFAPAAQGVFIDPGAALEEGFSRGGVAAMTAPFSHPGQFGWAMAVGACFAVAAATAGALPARTAIGSALASLAGIVASLRRKPLVALPLAIVFAFLSGLRRRQRIYALGATAILLAVFAAAASSRIEALVADTAANYLDPYNPTAARTLLYVTGWQLGGKYFPLGAGFGRFGGYISQIHYSPVYDDFGLSGTYGLTREAPAYMQDTYWPHVLGETGWLGIAVFATLLLLLWRRTMQVWRGHDDVWVRALAFGAATALVEAVIESAAAPIFEGTLFAYIIALPLAAALALGSARGAGAPA